jgi:hypothetical protein
MKENFTVFKYKLYHVLLIWLEEQQEEIPDNLYHASFRINVNRLAVLDKSIIVFSKCKTLQINPARRIPL